MLGTREVVAVLRGEGYVVSKSRLDGMIASGRIESPGIVGTSRAWDDADIQGIREALVRLDGPPRAVRAAMLNAAAKTRGGAR